MPSVDNKRPLKVFPSTGSGQAFATPIPLRGTGADRDPVRGLYSRLTQDGVDAWLGKEKLIAGQGFDTPFGCNLPDWELKIRKAV